MLTKLSLPDVLNQFEPLVLECCFSYSGNKMVKNRMVKDTFRLPDFMGGILRGLLGWSLTLYPDYIQDGVTQFSDGAEGGFVWMYHPTSKKFIKVHSKSHLGNKSCNDETCLYCSLFSAAGIRQSRKAMLIQPPDWLYNRSALKEGDEFKCRFVFHPWAINYRNKILKVFDFMGTLGFGIQNPGKFEIVSKKWIHPDLTLNPTDVSNRIFQLVFTTPTEITNGIQPVLPELKYILHSVVQHALIWTHPETGSNELIAQYLKRSEKAQLLSLAWEYTPVEITVGQQSKKIILKSFIGKAKFELPYADFHYLWPAIRLIPWLGIGTHNSLGMGKTKLEILN